MTEDIINRDRNSPRYLAASWWTDEELLPENLGKPLGCPELDDLIDDFRAFLASLRTNQDEG